MRIRITPNTDTFYTLTGIGSDHGTEQENRALKVLGGIKEILISCQALGEYFPTVVEIGNIFESFAETFGKQGNNTRKKDDFFQLSCSKRIRDNVNKTIPVIESYDVTFYSSDCVHNILTKRNLPGKAADRFLDVNEIGKAHYNKFVKEKLESDKSKWDTIKEEKLNTFCME